MKWTDFTPQEAKEAGLVLTERLDIEAPLNEIGERCPWPWEPQQLVGVPLGQYHCPYCGAMVLAGVPHLDYRDEGEATC
jgi:hypothetical protein